MLKRTKKLLEHNAFVIAVIATCFIIVLSLTNLPNLNIGIKIKSSDKYLHAFAYFFLSFLWHFAFRKKVRSFKFKILLIIAIIIFGIIIEILQGGITNYRTTDFYDALANTVGIVMATMVFGPFIRWYHTI